MKKNTKAFQIAASFTEVKQTANMSKFIQSSRPLLTLHRNAHEKINLYNRKKKHTKNCVAARNRPDAKKENRSFQRLHPFDKISNDHDTHKRTLTQPMTRRRRR